MILLSENKMIKLLKKVLAFFGLGDEKVIAFICGSEALPKPLSSEEEAEVIARAAKGDNCARDTLVERNLRLVVYLAKKFDNTGIEMEDLVSVGTIGLIKAVNSFESEKKIKLATYASRCIENEILMYLRKLMRHRGEISLDEPLNIDGDGNELLLGDILGTEGDYIYKSMEDGAEKQLLYDCIAKLSVREKQIVDMRFGLSGNDTYTQKEVADLLGISQSYISRLEKKIFTRLKKDMQKLI